MTFRIVHSSEIGVLWDVGWVLVATDANGCEEYICVLPTRDVVAYIEES